MQNETPEQRDRERRILDRFAAMYGGTVRQTHTFCSFDGWWISPWDERCLLEVRTRSNPFAKYNSLIFSAEKFYHITQLAKFMNVRALLIAVWTDCAAVIDLPQTAADLRVEWGGNDKRNQAADHEPVVHFPRDWFTPLALDTGDKVCRRTAGGMR